MKQPLNLLKNQKNVSQSHFCIMSSVLQINASRLKTLYQDNLLRGIVNWSGAAQSVV